MDDDKSSGVAVHPDDSTEMTDSNFPNTAENLICTTSESVLTLDEVLHAPLPHTLTPWAGQHPMILPRWSVLKDPYALWFTCSIPYFADYDHSLARGAYVEGLWERDVVEFFLMNTDGVSYQEFNVSPAGAWWCCSFTDYRKRALVTRKPFTVFVNTEVLRTAWTAAFAVRFDELSIELNDRTSVHVAAISKAATRSGSASDPGRYFSSAPLIGKEPDFHSKSCFRRLSFVEVSEQLKVE